MTDSGQLSIDNLKPQRPCRCVGKRLHGKSLIGKLCRDFGCRTCRVAPVAYCLNPLTVGQAVTNSTWPDAPKFSFACSSHAPAGRNQSMDQSQQMQQGGPSAGQVQLQVTGSLDHGMRPLQLKQLRVWQVYVTCSEAGNFRRSLASLLGLPEDAPHTSSMQRVKQLLDRYAAYVALSGVTCCFAVN